MSTELFAATMETSRIVGREEELEQIRQAVFRPAEDRSCQIVFVQGGGGFGKTRLLQEVLWRLGHPSERNQERLLTEAQRQQGLDWSTWGEPVVLGLIDLVDIRLHASDNFVYELYRRLAEMGVIFSSYLSKRQRHQQLVQQGVDYLTARRAADEANEAFFIDYQALSKQRRVVWVIDTAEQLSFVTSEWLRVHQDPSDSDDKPLLRDEDMRFQTQQWLADQIRQGRLQNTTILFAGRDKEGAAFFESIQQAAQALEGQPVLIPVKRFEVETVREYFEVLAGDWRDRANTAMDEPEKTSYRETAEYMQALADDLDRLKVLWLYTGGQAVLLSLFADLVLEHSFVPPSLQVTFEEAVRRVGTDSPDHPTDELRWQQWQIEDHFTTLLFSRPRNRGTLYRDILEMLVRAPRGLSAEQLHFVLDSSPNTRPDEWIPDRRRIAQIEKAIQKGLRRFTLGKERQIGVGLQDEIYRIYAEHMAPHVYPSPDAELVWARMSDDDKVRYRENHEYEKKARQQLYQRLRDWAAYRLRELQTQQRQILLEEERLLENRLATLSPTRPRLLQFPSLGHEERDRRLEIYNGVVEQSLEYMHYSLLLKPSTSFNSIYTDLADEFWRATDETRDVLTQREMWRLLHDPYVMKFVELPSRPVIERRDETPLQVLRRAAQQEDVARWIKRFVIRKDYQRAVDFADAVERAVQSLPEERELDKNAKESWQHTLAWGERQIWREYARIYQGKAQEAVDALELVARRLVRLSQESTKEIVFPDRGRWGEAGFIGHPAEIRLRRVISVTYNFMGWGCANLREYRRAMGYYGQALYFARELGAKAHRATVLNNLARVESEMGRTARSVRLCLDGLNLRRDLGADLPIAMSHSTLAMIYNDQNRPDEAWRAAAKAMAYARRIEDPRTLGLALKHLGEALRRLAGHETRLRLGRTLPEAPDAVYDAAQQILEEAYALFTDRESPASREPLRLVETEIELGCLHRDWLLLFGAEQSPLEWRTHLNSAVTLLEQAAQKAGEAGWKQLRIDALVNEAWTYYEAGELTKALEVADVVEKEITPERLLRRKELPPGPQDYESIVYYQLGKLAHVRGLVAMGQFRERVEEIESLYPGEDQRQRRREDVHQDEHAQKSLKAAADAYVQGIVFAQLYFPRSSALAALYDTLYDYLVRFNQQELDDFARYEREFRQAYGVEKMKLENIGIIGGFLRECFGKNGPAGNSQEAT